MTGTEAEWLAAEAKWLATLTQDEYLAEMRRYYDDPDLDLSAEIEASTWD